MAAGDRTFIDTNILLYAHDASAAAKQPVARAVLDRLWAERAGTLSTQVLQEFYYVATRKLSPPVSRTEARQVIDTYSAWPTVILDPALILAATRLEEEEQLSFWDALIVEAARLSGATRLLTEDMQHGRVLGGVQIVNPFAPEPQAESGAAAAGDAGRGSGPRARCAPEDA
ncbi:MAG: PIN domain-containing protein [Chloroflexi bacterium]|nr:PIN domain-containing protein [Chloroflexota bacterium]